MKKLVLLIMAATFVWLTMPGLAAADCDTCGDVTGDGEVNIADLVALVDYFTKFIFPECLECGDVDCWPEYGGVTMGDLNYMVDWMFYGGPPPCDPDDDGEPDCGPCIGD